MTKISTYISTINALFFQSTLEQTIRQSLLFSDEVVVVNSVYSSDGTQILLDDLKSEYPNQIKLYLFEEDYNVKHGKLADKKTFALRKCTGDYCILQDDDELIHEKYANYIRQLPEICPDTLAFRFNTIHFYRSYDHYQTSSDWYQKKIYMVKNVPEIKHGKVEDDYDNHVICKSGRYIPLDDLTIPNVVNTPITSYHYGWCRNDCVLLIKKWFQEKRWHGNDYWEEREFPCRFNVPESLRKFEGTHPKHMRKKVEEEMRYPSLKLKEFDN